jgi:hypothetical protein
MQVVQGIANDDDVAFSKGLASMIKGMMMGT